jgi:hypothetical protein
MSQWLARLSRRVHNFLALERSPEEVASILASFIDGEPTGHGADNFMSIMIRDEALDAIREDFVRLTDRFEEWQPEQPYPSEGLRELRELIDRALAGRANS